MPTIVRRSTYVKPRPPIVPILGLVLVAVLLLGALALILTH